MPIIGVGTDLAQIGRFRGLLEQEKVAVIARIFTAGEREYALAKKDPAPHLAARFAAKEAFLKALGLGLRRGMTWQDIEVVRDDLGKPSLCLSGRAAELCRERDVRGVHLSYSHDGDYAQAVVILEAS
ncbi:holo-[acyl-carrier protein] synthase [Geoalkalibacter ferrihydriticus]|uniref:Holo-[acyl-carrier-protein] synthase n=2 Tax=Geoalkalibacter ferrihydriticus TaxID=392333 RepID=A0A0C2HJ71_9BACT|nr:holo-ACP synthase [Geoalkalibacter ferrihydriticus]KIH77096.1 4'-phosphopantetheinyl transferase [Geoalkalibacter ferrihydriticus DSM 17813]SDL34614.1 holo-[acyl-carrier protein] synthase [Geoalkalibacter ferrihydriticus]